METISADELRELQERAKTLAPEKLVIVTGPTFCTVVKLLLLGGALGATGVMLLREKTSGATHSVSDTSTPSAPNRTLLTRIGSLAGHLLSAARFLVESARPNIEEAIQEGRKAAQQTERDLESELAKDEL
jgi:hypothetical protein